MGYRLTIRDLGNPQIEFTGTKLYGYCDTQELLSFQYLKEIGKLQWVAKFKENYLQ